MAVLVFGASGQIGRFLVPRLVASGRRVVAVSRQPHADGPGVHWLRGHLPDAVPRVPALEAIVSFGPLQPFARWLADTSPAGAPQVIATSSMSVLSKADSPVATERAIVAQLRAGEQELASACARIGSRWTVLRPTIIYGAGLDHSLTPVARRALRTRVFPLPAGRGMRQPVHADDIALAALAALERPGAGGRVLSIGGGERLPAAQMFARVRRSLPVATVPLPLPAWSLRLAQGVLPRLRGPLMRLEADLVADNDALERELGVHPRPFRPDPRCWGL